MKSKRLLSLAMAAVMSMSALSYCASIKTPVGIVANAEVTYSATGTQIPLQHIQAKVTYSQSDIKTLWEDGNLKRQFPNTKEIDGHTCKLYTWDGTQITDSFREVTVNDLGAYEYRYNDGDTTIKNKLKVDYADAEHFSVRFSTIGLKSQKSKNTTFHTYYGWKKLDNINDYVSGDEYETRKSRMKDWFMPVSKDDTYDQAKQWLVDGHKVDGVMYKRLKSSDFVEFTVTVDGSNIVAAFQTTGTRVNGTDEDIYAELERQAQKEADEAAETKANNKKNDYVSGKQSKWNGWNNVYDTKKMQKTSRILYIDENNTGKEGVQYIPPKGKGIYSESDVEGLKKICGVTDVEKAYVFEIHIPSRYELIDGKNMVVRLDLDHKAIGANTDGYNVYLYHMVDGKAKRVRKIGWRMYYVVFAANSFSPYVLVLTPKDQKRGVASTGAVLYANPPTGEGDVVPVAMLAASAFCMSCLLTVRKRKEQEV